VCLCAMGRVSVIGENIQFVQYKNHYVYEMSPFRCACLDECVCVCVCVYYRTTEIVSLFLAYSG